MNNVTEMIKSCKMAWNEPNSIPKWSFCYALMVLSVMGAFDSYGAI